MPDTTSKPTCIYCKQESIKVENLRMGPRCYDKLRQALGKKKHRVGGVVYRELTDGMRERYKRHLVASKGEQFVDDVLSVECKPFATHVAVAERYGLSRERIRQIYMHLTGKRWRDIKNERNKKIEKEIGCRLDPRNRLSMMSTKDCHARRGIETEVQFIQECRRRGLDVSCPPSRDCDTIINGYNIEVKLGARNVSRVSGPYVRYARAHLTENSFKVSDFIAIYHYPIETWFIIPIKAIPDSGIIYISDHITSYKTSKNRYWEFKEAWHLLTSPLSQHQEAL